MNKYYFSKKPFLKRAVLSLATLAFIGVGKSSAQVSLTATTGTTSGTYTTLNDAFAAINAGTHKGTIAISITANTTEPSTVTPLYGSGTASASSSSYTSVTIKPSGGNWTINSAASPTANRGVVELAGADNVTIDGDDASTTGTRNLSIVVATTTNATAAIRVSSNSTSGADGANDVTIKNCNITGSRVSATATNFNYGIVSCNFSTSSLTGGAYNSQNLVIENNDIKRTYRGIYCVGASSSYPNIGLRIRNNVLGSSTAADNIGQYGIYCTYTSGSTTSTTNNAIIEGNDIQAGDYTTGYSSTVYGIFLSSYNNGMIIRRNNIHDIAQSSSFGYGAIGIYFGSTLNNDIRVENNFIRDITAQWYSTSLTTSLQNYGIYVSSVGTGTIINHNTIYLNKANATSYGVSNPNSACLVFSSASYSLSQFFNNILINNQGGVSSNAYGIITSGTSNLPSTANNNNIYCPSSGKIGYFSGAAHSTLSSWQSATGLDASSISESVSFTSATDLHIPTGTTSLCESGGVSTATSGVSVDYDNTTRPGTSTYGFGTAPDIGADEFNGQVVYTCTTPAPGATISTPATICFGQSVVLALTTATSGTGVTYQWQSSPNGILPYVDISGATSSTLTTTPTGPTYYRCKVTCKNGPVTTNSTPVQVAYSNNVLSSTSNVRCGTGTVSLAATASTGATLKWYTTATGGAPIGTGSPFTTPLISATTNYYVGAEASATGSATLPAGTASPNSSTGQSPFSLLYTSAHTQYLVLASDLSAAGFGPGSLTSLSFNVTTKSSSKAYSNYTIKLAHSTATGLTGLLSPTFTTVYGPATYNSVAGANNFTFGGGGFSWDGSSNILVDVCFDNVTPATGWSNTDAVSFVPRTYAATYGMYTDPTNLCGATSGGSATTVNALPQMTFNGTIICSSPRSLVTATVNTPPAFGITGTQTICNNTVAAMSVTSTLSSFNTYTWAPSTGLFTDAAATVAYTAGTSASTVYYKSTTAGATKYTCTANNTTTLCAATDTAWITNLPSSMTTTATPANICFTGNTKLTFSPTANLGAAQFQWQTSGDNSSWGDSTGMTGTSLNTATLSNTRYYRVVLKNGAGVFCLNSSSDTALVLKPSVVTVTDAVRCAPGSVTLGATGIDGTINWFDASTGGTLLSTGTSYNTPSIASTTTYFAEVRATPDETYTTGTGTSILSGSGTTPFSLFWETARTQYLITASDLSALGVTAGQFATMAFNVSSKYSTNAYDGYTIKLAHTTATTLAGFLAPTFTTVYGPNSYATTSGANVFNLTGGFAWDGTSNIVVEVCFSNAATTSYSDNDYVTATTKSYTASYGTYTDGAFFCGGGSSSLASSSMLPNITFTRLGCKSSRSPVVATINPLPVPTISPSTGPVQICAGNVATFTGGGGGTYQWRDAAGLISGATSSSFSTGTTGSYRVIVTNPTTGCKDSSVVVAVNVNPTPTVSIAPAPTTAICADSSQKLTSVVSGTGLTYQWFRGGTAITSATTDSLRVNTSGVYTLRVYLGTCSDTSNDATIVVNPLPTSSFAKTGTTGAICLGSTLELTALSIPSTSTYQWSRDGIDIPGATSQIYNAAIGGIYTVRIKDNNNCRKTSDTMKVINTPMGIPNLLPKDLRFCEGTIVKLYANAGPFADSFAWSKNGLPLSDTTSTIETGDLGFYAVTVTDVYGCTLTSTTSTITVDPLPIKPIIDKTGSILMTSIPYFTYQWYRNGKIIVGATSRSYTISFDGDYHVVVTNGPGCKNISDILSVQNLSVKQIVRDGVKIDLYPNPSQSIINIDAPIDVNLMIRDIQGKQIMELKNAKQVDMSAYADGIYIFTITDKEGVVVKMDKVVKRTN